ncbi:calcium-binding protein [Mesorhizobium sp. IMUNJ 23232]|uniref:calcium-binding protein n=1 Tax=Mesorhizobium sp. IMUNJ 23232 TaxID=3376064 RepID=UPI0037A22145
MPAYTIDGKDDIIVGTPDDDIVTGSTGGTDQIDTGSGSDTVTITREALVYEIEYVDEDGNVYMDYGYDGMAAPFSGSLEGGAGSDILVVSVHNPYPQYPVPEAPFTFEQATVSGFEILEAWDRTIVSIAQLNGFGFVRGQGSDVLDLVLFGAGGSLDLSARSDKASETGIDARSLTSGLRLEGSARSDVVYDSAFDDHIKGGLGDDGIYWSAGVDYLSGGEGVDTLHIDWAEPASLLFKPVGVQGVLPNGTQFVGFEQYVVSGGKLADEITGAANDDILRGGIGDDILYGLGGNDELFGGVTSNEVGLTGRDELHGGDGDDNLYANGDSLGYGGTGRDTLYGRNGDNVLHGEAGNDTLYGQDGRNVLYGGVGYDSLSTNGGDHLFGDAGDDQLVARGNGSMLHGGAGNDRFYVDSSPSDETELYGDDGDDFMNASGRGIQRLDGGRGADEMRGSRDDDTYVVDQHGDVIIELVNQGTDTVEIRYSYILGANLENLLLTGTADANGWGNELSNTLTGNDGGNRLNGLGGADIMKGGLGNDIYVVNLAGDQVVEGGVQGSDTVLSSIDYSLGAAVEHLTLLGSADRTATGNTGANRLTGNAGDNILVGNGGADALKGNLGADIFRYLALSDSSVSSIDRIDDFGLSQGDVVDISAIDANARAGGDQAFNAEIGAGATFSAAGQYRFSAISGGFLAEFNVDADADAEFAIRFLGAAAPQAGWFLL